MVWCNGSLAPVSEIRLSPFDHGFTVGGGVFETLVAESGEPFAFTRHWRRLVRSAAPFGLEPPACEIMREACRSVVAANALGRCRIRITLTGGISPLGSARGNHPPTVTVAAEACPPPAPSARVVVVPWTRNEHGACSGLKTTSYAENILGLAWARQHGADEAIFSNTAGHLCEGSGSNVWTVRGGALHTPGLDSGCLAGITRELVLELCLRLGLAVEESPAMARLLASSDEAFLTSTLRDVQPVSEADGHLLQNAPGPVTARLARAFAELRITMVDP